MRTIHQNVEGWLEASSIAERLIIASAWVCVEPLPYDYYRVYTKDDPGKRELLRQDLPIFQDQHEMF